MSDREDYYERAESWAAATRALTARSRRIAWTVAGVAVAVAVFEAVALAMLAPLKTVQPVTLLVDKQTGYVQALDPLTPRRVAADEGLTNSLLAQYVTAREGFDRATIAADYRRVALWSAGRARQTYLAQIPATNPASPFQRLPAGAIVDAQVKSVSHLNPGLALVRFDTVLEDRNGSAEPPQPWIAVVRFRYTDAPMRFEDRLVNPLGFQVTGYRRDAEAPPPPPLVQAAIAASPPASRPAVVTTTTVVTTPPASAPPVIVRTPPMVARPPSTVHPYSRPSAPALDERMGSLSTREIPLSNLPMGSPLSPGGAAVAGAQAGDRR